MLPHRVAFITQKLGLGAVIEAQHLDWGLSANYHTSEKIKKKESCKSVLGLPSHTCLTDLNKFGMRKIKWKIIWQFLGLFMVIFASNVKGIVKTRNQLNLFNNSYESGLKLNPELKSYTVKLAVFPLCCLTVIIE